MIFEYAGGFFGTVIPVLIITIAALRPPLPRTSSPFRVSFILGYAINELPLVGLVWLGFGALDTVRTGVGSLTWWVAVVITACAGGGLVWLAARAHLARGALEIAFAGQLHLPIPRTPAPVLRILVPVLVWHPRVRALRNQPYGPARAQRLDVYRPRNPRADSQADGSARAPVLLYFHGGGFVMGSKYLGAWPLLHRLAAHGWVTASANYRLRTPYENSLADARSALAWVREHARELGADPTRIVVAGGSAGALLAMTLALTDPAISAGIGCYGYYGDLAAPAEAPGPAPHPALLVLHGSLDTLVPVHEARAFAARARQDLDSPVAFVELPGTQHNFDFFYSMRFHSVCDGIEAFANWATSPAVRDQQA